MPLKLRDRHRDQPQAQAICYPASVGVNSCHQTPLTSDSLVVLASSLYFKASWELKFNIMSEQKANEFCWTTTVQDLLNSNCEESITWMYKEESVPFTKFKKFANNDVTVFEMPLKNSRASTGPNIKV